MPMGHVSLAGSVVAWLLLVLTLVSGGLDPHPPVAPLLRFATTAALGASVLALAIGILAVFRGDKGAPAALGIGGSLLFLLMFSGIGWMFIR